MHRGTLHQKIMVTNIILKNRKEKIKCHYRKNKRKERHPKQSKQGKTGITWRRKEKTIFTILREGKDIVSPSNNYRSNDQNSS